MPLRELLDYVHKNEGFIILLATVLILIGISLAVTSIFAVKLMTLQQLLVFLDVIFYLEYGLGAAVLILLGLPILYYATISFLNFWDRVFYRKKHYDEEFCPIADMSRGGLRFLSQRLLKINSKITLKVSVPGERIPLILEGRVRWSASHSGQSYSYQIGVQFNPYGEKKEQNNPAKLTKIIALEQKFSEEKETETPEQTAEPEEEKE